MRAVVHERYGPPEVLRLEEVELPVPKDDEVLVEDPRDDGHPDRRRPSQRRILHQPLRHRPPPTEAEDPRLRACRRGRGSRRRRQRVRRSVTRSSASTATARTRSSFCMRESAPLAHKPAGMTFEQAAAVCDGAALALACLRNADLRKGRSILVYGASGSVGTAGVQLAHYFGADVTAVSRHQAPRAGELARSRQCRRLHPGRFHQERRDLRRHLRRGRQALVQALQTLIESGGHTAKPTSGSCGTCLYWLC